MTTTYIQPGDVIDYVNGGTARTSGQVIKMGNTLGVCLTAIAANATGPVAIKGVFVCPKVSGAVIAQGESLTWDVSANSNAGAFDDNLATPATGDVTGAAALAAEAGTNGMTALKVLLTGAPGTVT